MGEVGDEGAGPKEFGSTEAEEEEARRAERDVRLLERIVFWSDFGRFPRNEFPIESNRFLIFERVKGKKKKM